MNALLSLILWTYLILSCVVLFCVAAVLWLITRPFDSEGRVLHRFSCWWGYHYMILCPNWHCTIEGREKIPNHRASVIVANHQSLVDILALYGLNRHFKWVSKEAIFKLPFIGWNMSLNNYVRLKRGRRSSILSMMDSCHRHIRRGNSILLFPEGTRSKNGEILAFKQGAFNLAVEADIPIVPIIIDGTTTALPKSGWIMRVDQRVQIQVRVLDPVSPAEYQGEAEQLAKAVRVQMMQALADIQQPSPPL